MGETDAEDLDVGSDHERLVESEGDEPGESLGDRAALVLGPHGPIARGLAEAGLTYEPREGQIAMARAVAEAIERDRVLLCEAGTGTGKTLAYLVPAILSGRRVIVSTATKALQEQIYVKDLPLLASHLGVPVHAALMKGLSNYLCLRRLDEARKGGLLGPLLGRIEAWAAETETGDRAELSFLRDDDPMFREVQSGSDTRVGSGCAFYDRCFVTRMRNAAMQARLVVVNHHLYLADLSLRRTAPAGVLPPHEVVVFDEAHQLEEIATEFFGVRVSSAKIEAWLRDARRSLSAVGKIPRSSVTRRGRAAAPAVSGSLDARFDGVSRASERFFQEIARHRGVEEGRAPLSSDAWTKEAWDACHALDAAIEAATLGIHEEEASARGDEIAAMGRRGTALRDDLAHVADPGRDDVPWIDVRARSCAIGVSPLDMAPVLRDELFANRERDGAFVLTSATLTTAGTFAYAKRRLGLVARRADEDGNPGPERDVRATMELLVPSPFDFQRNAGVYVPLDLPEPSDATFVERAGTRVVELVRASRGGAFVLCASTRNMRALHACLVEAGLPWPILCQGERPKTSLLDDFRRAGHGILVATMGFWEGVDVPGSALRLVVIDKLPFAVPTDPVVAARYRAVEEEGRSAFAEISVPDAAISLKQGFGRLIRSRDDAGVVAILDKRLRTKGYGRVLRASLPNAAPLHDVADVRRFFDLVVLPRSTT